MRCQPRLPPRRKGANWNAPSRQKTVALPMCVTTGTGEAKNRAFCGVTAAPPVNSVRRAAPAMTGMRLRKIKAAGTGHWARGRRTVAGAGSTTAVLLVEFIVNPLLDRPVRCTAYTLCVTVGVPCTLVKQGRSGRPGKAVWMAGQAEAG